MSFAEGTAPEQVSLAVAQKKTSRQGRQRAPTKRQRPLPPPLLIVDFPIPLSFVQRVPSTAWVLHVATKAVLTYLLYASGIVPWPLHQILSSSSSGHGAGGALAVNNNEDDKSYRHAASTRQKRLERQVDQLRLQIDTVLNDLRTIMVVDKGSSLRIHGTLISWGSSFRRPRQVMWINAKDLLDCSWCTASSATLPALPNDFTTIAAHEHQLSTRLVRKLVQCHDDETTMSSSSSSSSRVQVYVTLGVTTDSLPGASLERLEVRHDFALRDVLSFNNNATSRGRKVQRGQINLVCQTTTAVDTMVEKVPAQEEEALTWLSLKSTIKGLRSS